jgi:creatinine amidohydrolase
MTTFHAYDELTWPEVSSLPRHTPFVLPLGDGFPLEQVAETMGFPPDVFQLPKFPFGWQGSCLSIAEDRLVAYLTNIIYSLRDEGFLNTLVLVPPGLNLPLPVPWIALPNDSGRNSDAVLPPDEDRGKVVLIPIGHTEQHGFHLPLSTDTLIIEAITQGTASKSVALSTILPVMPYGVSTHRQSFAGTLNSGGRAFEDFWVGVIDVLVARGFSRFYIMNGHGGNSSYIINAIKAAGDRHRRIFCATSWLYLSGPDGIASLEKHRESGLGGMGHACELETSFILHLKPELVHMERVVDETDFITTPSYYMDWVEGGALIANPPWDDDTKTGAYGAGSFATAEKGRIWLEAAIAEKVLHIMEIHEQQNRREERRRNGFGLWGKGG